MIQTITPQLLHKWLNTARDSFALIDVREPQEHDSCHIKGATLIPPGTLETTKLPLHTRRAVLYCHAGKRSALGCVKLEAQQPEVEWYTLEGGIVAWSEAGFPLNSEGNE